MKPVTIQEFTNLALDRAYKRSAGAMLLKIHTLSTDPSSDMVLALNKLQQEAQGLTEQDKPIQTTNPKLKNALNAFGTVMLTAGLLIKENSPAIEATAQAIAIPSVTAKVFLNVSEDLIAKGIDPLGVKAWARLQVAASKTKVPFTIPTTLDYVENYVDSPAWIARMEGWGSGYSARVKDIVEQGIAGGWSPKYTAQAVSEYAQNIPYAAAENITRTLQLTAYREASLAMETINGGFITGKIRIATLDERTCLVPNTLIDTVSGSKPIQDIRVGDLVKTHKGTYEKVTDAMSKDYSRQTVNIKTKDGHLECTDDHPVLVLRKGYCHWIPAKDIQVGDSLFIASDNGSYNLDHISGDTSVKWSIGNPDDIVSIGVQSNNLPRVGIWSFGMPINPVNFKSNVHTWNKEVNSISIYLGLLLKRYSNLFKAQSDILLWFTLATVLMITAWATKLLTFGVFAGAKSVFLSTIQTLIHEDGTPANLGAVCSLMPTRGVEFFATSFADKFPSLHILPFAIYGAIMITICIGLWNSEFFSAPDTRLVTSSTLKFTFGRTIIKVRPLYNFTWSKFKLFATSLASKLLPIPLLPDGSALHGATHPSSRTFDLGSQNSKFFSTNSTSKAGKFSAHVVLSSNLSNRSYIGKVYNLEVENEHTYLANGFVVHNCLSCIALHGTQLAPGERVDDHYRGRCTEFYQVPGGPEYPDQMQSDSTPGHRNFVKFQTGEEWFANLPPERQARQASFLKSPAKLRAYKDGTPLSAFVGDHVDNVFGNQKIEKSLLGTLGSDASKYYGSPPSPRTPTPTAPFTQSTPYGIGEFENSIYNQQYETAGVYSSDGKLLFTKDGTKSSVKFTIDELNQLNGATLTHNHPSGTSFSRDDIKLFLNEKVKEIRAVDSEFVHSMINGNSVKMTNKAVDRLYQSSLRQSIINNPNASDIDILSDAWNIFANKIGLTYIRTAR